MTVRYENQLFHFVNFVKQRSHSDLIKLSRTHIREKTNGGIIIRYIIKMYKSVINNYYFALWRI